MGGGHRKYNRTAFFHIVKEQLRPVIERFLILRNSYQTSLYSHLLLEPDYRVHNLSNLEIFVI